MTTDRPIDTEMLQKLATLQGWQPLNRDGDIVPVISTAKLMEASPCGNSARAMMTSLHSMAELVGHCPALGGSVFIATPGSELACLVEETATYTHLARQEHVPDFDGSHASTGFASKESPTDITRTTSKKIGFGKFL